MSFCQFSAISRLFLKVNYLAIQRPHVSSLYCRRTTHLIMHREQSAHKEATVRENKLCREQRKRPDVTSGVLTASKLQEWIALGISCILGTFGASLWILRLVLATPRDLSSLFKVKERKLTPPVLSRSELGEHSYMQLPNGMRLHYVISGSTTKPLMLMLHGFPDFWFSWRHQIPFFNKDYRVVAVDMRGYGDSAKPVRLSAYHMSHFVEDVKLLIEGLGYKSCILVAHDWGGIVAWSFATLHPDVVDRLIVLNCPHPRAFWNYLKQGPKQWLKSWYIFVFQLPYIPELLLRARDLSFLDRVFRKPGNELMSEEELEAYKFTYAAPHAFSPPVNYYRNLSRNDPRGVEIRWEPIRCPTLIVFGTADVAISPETAQLSTGFVSGPCELKYLEGVEHFCQMEVPTEVNGIIKQFLK